MEVPNTHFLKFEVKNNNIKNKNISVVLMLCLEFFSIFSWKPKPDKEKRTHFLLQKAKREKYTFCKMFCFFFLIGFDKKLA